MKEKIIQWMVKGAKIGCVIKCILPVLLLLLSFCTYAQKSLLEKRASIHMSEKSLEEVLAALSKVYSVEFSYSDDMIPIHEIATISVENETLKVVLERLYQDFRIEYKVVKNRIILSRSSEEMTQTIRGFVADQSTNAPIPGANVVIEGTNPVIGGTTNGLGEYKISKVPVGRFNIIISCIGYTSKSLSAILLGTGKELVLDVKLSESIMVVNEVTVTANRHEVRSENEMAVVSSRSFSVEETKRFAGSVGDPAKMASSFAGVTNTGDRSNALTIRGNSPRGVLWRVEGIEVPNPNHFTTEGASGGAVSVLSTNMINNSDFLTGAFSSQYGNALSGVFDISLRDGNNECREHSFQVGVLGIEGSTEGPFKRNHSSSYLINYRYSTLSVLDRLGFGLNEIGEYKNYQDLSFKINIPTYNTGNFSLFGIGGLSRSDQSGFSKLTNDYSDVGIIGLTHQKVFRQNTFLRSTLSLSGTRISRFHELLDLQEGFFKEEERFAKAYLRTSVVAKRKVSSKYLLEGGLIYSRLFYDFFLIYRDSNNLFYSDIRSFAEQGKSDISQGFLQAKQAVSENLQLIYGIHSIYFNLTDDYSVEPRVSARWQLTPDDVFSIGCGKHSRIENLQYYLARDHQAGGKEVQVNKNLGFTRSNHYVLGYEKFLSGNLGLKLEAYYQQLYNVPVLLNPSSLYSVINEEKGFVTDTLFNKGKGRNYGIEASLQKSFSNNFYYLINGSLYQSKFSTAGEKERNTSYNGNFNFHFLAGYELESSKKRYKDVKGINLRITWAGGGRYIPINLKKSKNQGEVVYNLEEAFESRFPNYFRADLQFTYRKNKPGYSTEWRLDVQNLSNHTNPAFYLYDKESELIRVKNQLGLLPFLSYRIDF